ncbi:protein sym-1-like [Triticum urartu]|uniref:Protein Mpv17 n=1 Tax=Triticum urartu TaxID=4572 RepID=A0A8R7UGS5_TRIUA|nr:protein sym-1-like [Triticum urartu]XP_048529373.1 protein sym-1-like [Triticum urartu]XP_048529511.1 protein sym-1-like [Triticum urartu]XP_048529512.1 protein sym-1-like [Triticum urartu]
MALASVLPLLLVPRPIVSPRPTAAGRFLSLSAPLSTAAPAPAPVEPLKAGGRLARLQPLHAASCCNSASAAASGGVEAARAKGLQLVAWYLLSLDKHPVATKAVTSAVLTLAGDLICQLVIDKVPELDLKRTFVFTLLGLVLVGPTLHFWYLYLSKLVTISGTSGVISRLLLDQFVFSPVFIGVFMSLLVTLEGKPSLVVPKLKQEWFSSLIANWQLWIPFQFLNFYFVPQKLQVLAANFVALAWNVILSYKAHKKVIAE